MACQVWNVGSVEYTTVFPGLRDLFGINKSRAWTLLAEKKIRGRKLGKRTLVEVASVREFMASLPSARESGPVLDTSILPVT